MDYVAILPHVREVSIVGTADLGFWTDRLRAEGLVPLEVDGRAQILIISSDSRFKGLRFQELSFSIRLGTGAFLVQAFNSRRFFAFCERTFFGTPYDFGRIEVSASLPALVRLHRGQEPLFRAEMGAGAAPAAPGASPFEEGWAGPVRLPSHGQEKRRGRFFFAEVTGATQSITFQPSRDVLEIRPSKDIPVLQALIDSGFEATHWLVRPDARHAKSRTYRDSV